MFKNTLKTRSGDLERDLKQLRKDLEEKTEVLQEREQNIDGIKEKELRSRLQLEGKKFYVAFIF